MIEMEIRVGDGRFDLATLILAQYNWKGTLGCPFVVWCGLGGIERCAQPLAVDPLLLIRSEQSYPTDLKSAPELYFSSETCVSNFPARVSYFPTRVSYANACSVSLIARCGNEILCCIAAWRRSVLFK